jgi:ABC-type nickel/cobalt efflux system permease component RcnA
MISMLTFLTGFIASVAHVATGPDHLAAVTPLAIDSRKKSWIVGFSWGIGHTIGMLLIGLVFILFKEFLPIEAISKYSETVIGILLIGIGCMALARIYLRHSHGNRPHAHFHTTPYLYAHIHKHSHNIKPDFDLIKNNDIHGCTHNHLHVYNREHEHNHEKEYDHGHGHQHLHTGKVKQNALTALSIGIIHGFAGFSHLIALLPSLALPTVWASVIYISAFAFGTVLTMIIFAFILGLVAFQSVVKDKQVFLKRFTLTGAFLAIAIGILWIIHPI